MKPSCYGRKVQTHFMITILKFLNYIREYNDLSQTIKRRTITEALQIFKLFLFV